MVKRLKEKMNIMLEARKENKNKGFTLVELIVVIVILAILIGVTIGGVYTYVNKSRINTDINNASSIQSVCATLGTNKDVIKEMKKDATTSADATATLTWGNDTSDPTKVTAAGTYADKIKSLVDEMLTDGFPAPKVADKFVITVTCDTDGTVGVTCKAYSGDNELTAQE